MNTSPVTLPSSSIDTVPSHTNTQVQVVTQQSRVPPALHLAVCLQGHSVTSRRAVVRLVSGGSRIANFWGCQFGDFGQQDILIESRGPRCGHTFNVGGEDCGGASSEEHPVPIPLDSAVLESDRRSLRPHIPQGLNSVSLKPEVKSPETKQWQQLVFELPED